MHNFFEAKGRKLKACMAENGSGVFGRGSEPPSPPAARESGEHCKLSQWGPGQSPGHKRILVYFELENRIWWQLF